ncbi:hypothetical protein N7462_006522 [Penicillium macrosclerotiorum]|uniref:uncharacterized protein n=1 Tax=Penicillium macrosclerotiorum TaxID=303699 RepID=UPI002546B825|nr:uncharacterized protein N7462_006522 [Penicillium macrosclerotiorum]KAJ5683357.1 hypothetical protein N7462_006522 [Penicillium macrosclerotiorum]
MCDIPFFPIFPICFQCGTDQNPCHCKVVGPTLGRSLANLDLLWVWINADRSRVRTDIPPFPPPLPPRSNLTRNSMLGYPVKLNGQVSNAIPF